jgi:hypothetical protein
MNDHDWDIIQRELNKDLTPYEKVLAEKERRDRRKADRTNRLFDWFVRDAIGEFYNYDPRDD